MSIQVQCPGCATRYSAPDHAAGKRLRCRHCGGAIAVPGAAPTPAAARGAKALPPDSAPPPDTPDWDSLLGAFEQAEQRAQAQVVTASPPPRRRRGQATPTAASGGATAAWWRKWLPSSLPRPTLRDLPMLLLLATFLVAAALTAHSAWGAPTVNYFSPLGVAVVVLAAVAVNLSGFQLVFQGFQISAGAGLGLLFLPTVLVILVHFTLPADFPLRGVVVTLAGTLYVLYFILNHWAVVARAGKYWLLGMAILVLMGSTLFIRHGRSGVPITLFELHEATTRLGATEHVAGLSFRPPNLPRVADATPVMGTQWRYESSHWAGELEKTRSFALTVLDKQTRDEHPFQWPTLEGAPLEEHLRQRAQTEQARFVQDQVVINGISYARLRIDGGLPNQSLVYAAELGQQWLMVEIHCRHEPDALPELLAALHTLGPDRQRSAPTVAARRAGAGAAPRATASATAGQPAALLQVEGLRFAPPGYTRSDPEEEGDSITLEFRSAVDHKRYFRLHICRKPAWEHPFGWSEAGWKPAHERRAQGANPGYRFVEDSVQINGITFARYGAESPLGWREYSYLAELEDCWLMVHLSESARGWRDLLAALESLELDPDPPPKPVTIELALDQLENHPHRGLLAPLRTLQQAQPDPNYRERVVQQARKLTTRERSVVLHAASAVLARWAGQDTLRDLEGHMLDRLKSPDSSVKIATCDVLFEIGTAASIPALTELSESGGRFVAFAASGALSQVELRERRKERAATAQARAASIRAAARGAPFRPAAGAPRPLDIPGALEQLRQRRGPLGLRGPLAVLAQADPDPQYKDQVLQLAGPLAAAQNPLDAAAALRVLARWGGADATEALLEGLAHDGPQVRKVAMEKLVEVNPQRAAAALAPRLGDLLDGAVAGALLRRIGAPAEVEVLKMLAHADEGTKAAACEVLRDIGTARSVSPLGALAQHRSVQVSRAAREALVAVQARLRDRRTGP